MLRRVRRLSVPARLLCLLGGVCGLLPGVRALDPARQTSQHAVQQWSLEHGLPDAYVQAITQTGDGYLWLGTQNAGVVRFDGVQFTPVLGGLKPEEAAVSVRTFCETRDGTLWVATDGAGLWRYVAGRFTRLGREQGLPTEHVYALHEDAEGVLWAGVASYHAVRLEGARFVQPEALRRLPQPGSVYAMCEDAAGGMWLAGRGLWYLQAGELTAHHERLALPGERFLGVTAGADGVIWVASTRGVLRLRDGHVRRYTEADGLSDNRVRCVRVDRDGLLWAGSNSGLDRLHGERFIACSTREQTPFDLVYTIFEDREGSLWIGSNSGLGRVKDDKFALFTTREGLPQNIVTCALEARDGSLWLGTWSRGVTRLSGGTARTYTRRDGLPCEAIRCLHEDARGVLWVGTETGGAARIAGGTVSPVPPEALGGARSVVAIESEAGGRLWLLAEHGRVLRQAGAGFEEPAHPVLTGAGPVQALRAGRGGGLWLAASSALLRVVDESWTAQAYPAELAGRAVRSLYEDGEGAVWISAEGEALVRLAAGRHNVFTPRHGVPWGNFYGVIEDGRGDLWVSGKQGVFLLSRQELRDLEAGRREVLAPVDFTRLGGLHNPRFLRLGHPPALRLRDGRLCFPTTKGAALVNPERLPRNPVPPPVFIEQVLADRQPLDEGPRLRLPRRVRDVEIHYTALGLRTPERVRFRYRLEGLDEDWVEAGPRRVAYYQNLPPGEYRFHVIAANEDGVWNEAGAALELERRPQLHQTLGFRMLGGAVLLGAGLGWHRRRVRQQQQRFELVLQERLRIARDLHDRLEQGLVAVSMQLNLALRQPAPAAGGSARHLEKARFMLRHCMAEARAAVLDLRRHVPEHDLRGALERLAGTLAGPGTPAVTVREHGRRRPLPPGTVEALLRVAQEALTNACKHARASRVEMEVRHASGGVTLRVRDDGCGFETAAPPPPGHFGLLGMRERCEMLRGTLRIVSTPGQGTLVELHLPDRTAAPPAAAPDPPPSLP